MSHLLCLISERGGIALHFTMMSISALRRPEEGESLGRRGADGQAHALAQVMPSQRLLELAEVRDALILNVSDDLAAREAGPGGGAQRLDGGDHHAALDVEPELVGDRGIEIAG